MFVLQIGSVAVDNEFDPLILKGVPTSYTHLPLEDLYNYRFPRKIAGNQVMSIGHLLVEQSDLDCTDERAFPKQYSPRSNPRQAAKDNMLAHLQAISAASPRAWVYIVDGNRGWLIMSLAQALTDRADSPLYRTLAPSDSK